MLRSDTSKADEAVLKLGGGAAVAVGVVLGLGTAVVLFALPRSVAFDFAAVQIGLIGGVYLGFALADGRFRVMLIEAPVAVASMLIEL